MTERAKLAAGLIIALALALAACRTHEPSAPHPAYSVDLLYNLGNSYARAGKPGMAVLNYERARLLAPGDPDIEANLRFVRNAARLPAEPIGRLQRAAVFFNPSTVAWAEVIGVLLIGIALLAGRWPAGRWPAGRRRWWRRSALFVGLVPIVVTVCNGVLVWPLMHDAVVVADAAPARASPVPMADQLFTLSEGETVHLTAEHEGFVLIRTPRGQAGWVSRTSVAPVLPR